MPVTSCTLVPNKAMHVNSGSCEGSRVKEARLTNSQDTTYHLDDIAHDIEHGKRVMLTQGGPEMRLDSWSLKVNAWFPLYRNGIVKSCDRNKF